jgi:hypothetical protein
VCPHEARAIVTNEVSGVASKKAAIRWLNRLKHPQRPSLRQLAEQACERISRRSVMMNRLPNGDQRRQRITHYREPQRTEELMW